MNREMRRQLEKRQRTKGDFKTQFKVAKELQYEEKQEWFMKGFVRGGSEALAFIREEMIHIDGIGQKTIDRIYNGLHKRMREQKQQTIQDPSKKEQAV
jgi:endonuclease III-like uncharacterized protein